MRLNFFLVACCSLLFLLVTRYSLLVARYFCLLLVTFFAHCSLLFARCSLLFARCSLVFLLIARYFLLDARYFSLVARYFLLDGRYFSLVARYFLLDGRYFLLVARYFFLVTISQLLWATVRLLVVRVTLTYLVDKFFIFSCLVLLKEMRTQGDSKISSCCFRVSFKSRELGGRWGCKIPLCNPSGRMFLRTSLSYNNLLGRVAFKILSNIHDGALLQK